MSLLPFDLAHNLRIVGRRVDYLTVGYRIWRCALEPFLSTWQTAFDEEAQRCGLHLQTQSKVRLPWNHAGHRFILSRGRGNNCFLIEHEHMRLHIDPSGSQGWCLKADFGGCYFLQYSLEDALDFGRELVGALVGRRELLEERVRRLDLNADMSGAHFDFDDRHNLVTPARATITEIAPGASEDRAPREQSLVVTHGGVTELETLQIGKLKSGGISACIYNKTAELSRPESEAKRSLEHRIWKQHGWDTGSVVWRIEFRVGNAALEESGLRDPNRLLSELDSLWSLATETIRLVVPSETRTGQPARPSRCPLDPRWALLTRVVFDHQQPPTSRVRVKGGADMKQAVGTALSWLASEQVPVKLPDLEELHSMQEQLSREEVVEQSVQIAQAICQAFEAAMIQTPRIAKEHSAERISRTWLAYIVNRLRASGVVIQPKTRA